MAKNVLTYNLSEPLNGATAATVDISAGDGNLTIDRLADGAQMLATGALQYLEKQGEPSRTLVSGDGEAALTLKGGGGNQTWLRLPWAACNGATEWQIQLNPAVVSDLNAHSDGGNIKLNLAGTAITRVSADTGGGNVEVVLPEAALNLSVIAKTGAGNVVVQLPIGVAARIQAITGLGKAVVDPQFSQTGKNTYQSPGYDSAAHKVEITASSGAGNVVIETK